MAVQDDDGRRRHQQRGGGGAVAVAEEEEAVVVVTAMDNNGGSRRHDNKHRQQANDEDDDAVEAVEAAVVVGGGGAATTAAAAATPPSAAVDLRTCAPRDLARWLFERRFLRGATSTVSSSATSAAAAAEATSRFLRNAVDSVPSCFAGGGAAATTTASVAVASAATENGKAAALADDDPPSSIVGESLLAAAAEDDDDDAVGGGTIEVSCTNPRGKFLATFGREGLLLVDKNLQRIVVRPQFLEHLVVFPKPEDCQKLLKGTGGGASKKKPWTPTSYALLVFRDPNGDGEDDAGAAEKSSSGSDNAAAVSYKNKTLRQLCVQLPSTPVRRKAADSEKEVGGYEERIVDQTTAREITSSLDDWLRILCTALHFEERRVARVAVVGNGVIRKGAFASYQEEGTSTTTGGMPFVKCYLGVQDGALFPLKEGLLFFKPPRFVASGEMKSIACQGRGGGGEATRYADLVVALHSEGDDEELLEFTNIHKTELGPLNKYIHGTLIPAMLQDGNGADGDDAQVSAEAVAEDEEDENDDSEEESDRVEGRRPKRKAGLEARASIRQQERVHNQANRARGGGDSDDDDSDDDDQQYLEKDDVDEDEDGMDESTTVLEEDNSQFSAMESSDEEQESEDEEEFFEDEPEVDGDGEISNADDEDGGEEETPTESDVDDDRSIHNKNAKRARLG